MDRTTASVLFATLLLLLAQVLQGVTADAMAFTTVDGARDTLAAEVATHCGSGHVAMVVVAQPQPAHTRCPFCASGLRRIAHAPALPLTLEVAGRPVPPTYDLAPALDGRLDTRIYRILRPPR